MKIAGIFAAVVVLTFSIGSTMAVPPGKTLEFTSSKGQVTFNGKAHADKGLKCADCHTKPKLFEMKRSASKTTMATMAEGKSCGSCHDGKKAFSVKSPADCAKCHTGAAAKAEATTPAQNIGAIKVLKEETSASVPKKESAGDYIDDAVVTAKIKAAVLEDASLKSAEINVETLKGVVQLSGFVRSREDIDKAVLVAKGVKGVKSVKNDMILKGTQ